MRALWSRASRAVTVPVTKHSVSPMLPVPSAIPRPPYVGASPPASHPAPQLHTPAGIACMRASCKVAADALVYAGKMLKPGMTTDELDVLVHDFIVQAGAYPSPLGYAGFPKSICTSINEVLCHGIPDSRVVCEGDLVSVDVSCFLNGYHGDNCRTFVAGQGSEDSLRLMHVGKRCLDESVRVCGPGFPVRSIADVITRVCAEASAAAGYSFHAVPEFMGHGIGHSFHTHPLVGHCPNSSPWSLKPGMTFTIEPIIVAGDPDLEVWSDGWTAVARGQSPSVQFEHTLLVTDTGVEVLTSYEDDASFPAGVVRKQKL